MIKTSALRRIRKKKEKKNFNGKRSATSEKEKFILRPDLMSPIRKTSLLYVRSDIYSRDLLRLLDSLAPRFGASLLLCVCRESREERKTSARRTMSRFFALMSDERKSVNKVGMSSRTRRFDRGVCANEADELVDVGEILIRNNRVKSEELRAFLRCCCVFV